LACTEARLCLADEMWKIPHTAAVQYTPSDSEEESDIYDLEEDWEDRVSNLPRKLRILIPILFARKLRSEIKGSWIFRISSDPIRVFQGSSAVFIWGLREDLISQPAFKGLTFGFWKNGHLTTYIISLTKSGRIIPNPDLDDQLTFFAGRVQWIGNLTKSFAAFEVSQISARDQMDYGIELHFGAFKDPVSDFVRLEVVAERTSAMTTVWSPPLSVQPGSNASFQCQFYVGEADEPVFDYVTVGLWERGGISSTLLTLTKRGNVIVNPKLNKEAPLYAGRVHGRQWKNTTTNTSGITVKIEHVEESDEGFYGCSIFFGAFKGVLGESVKIDVQGPYSNRLNITLNGTLEIYHTEVSDSNTYKCSVHRVNYTSPERNFVTLQVDTSVSPKITEREPSKIVHVQLGSVLFLKCKAEGVPKPVVTWRKDGRLIQNKTDETYFKRENASKDDEGKYECEASNSAGSDSYKVDVIIKGKDSNNNSNNNNNTWRTIALVVVGLFVAVCIGFCFYKKVISKPSQTSPPEQHKSDEDETLLTVPKKRTASDPDSNPNPR
ncbi:unnamed protein product, partial [Porites evermanni]